MASILQIDRSAAFTKNFKKLYKNQQLDIERAIYELSRNPLCGELKTGDLSGIHVYKFRMLNQLTLLAYRYYEQRLMLKLIKFGSHENFYSDLKKTLQ